MNTTREFGAVAVDAGIDNRDDRTITGDAVLPRGHGIVLSRTI